MKKKITIFLLIALVLIQFYRPQKNSSSNILTSDFLLTTKASDTISSIFKISCYDCHSNNTNYPWYSEISPISWLIAHHVDEGKEELNFSVWNTFSEKRKRKKIKEMLNELKEREMPLKTYLPLHPKAKLSDRQIDLLTNWIESLK